MDDVIEHRLAARLDALEATNTKQHSAGIDAINLLSSQQAQLHADVAEVRQAQTKMGGMIAALFITVSLSLVGALAGFLTLVLSEMWRRSP